MLIGYPQLLGYDSVEGYLQFLEFCFDFRFSCEDDVTQA